ncbi:MAG: YdeI/OmpD-associated family protein [Bacteroidota bacterium]
MNVTETLYVSTRAAWRRWLERHHAAAAEIWLVTYRKHTGTPSIPYNDAVEEALCFGWIDSLRKGLDGERLVQRFTPRRPGSTYSQTNKERLARLGAGGQLHPSVEPDLAKARPETFEIPDDIRAALMAHEDAWAFFAGTSLPYQRIRAAYVDHARKRPAEFEKRLNHLVKKSAEGKQFGYGIEDYF